MVFVLVFVFLVGGVGFIGYVFFCWWGGGIGGVFGLGGWGGRLRPSPVPEAKPADRTGQDHIRQTLLPTTCSWNMSVQDPHCAPAEAGLIIFAAVNKELVHSGVFFGMVNTPERIIAVKAGFPAFP